MGWFWADTSTTTLTNKPTPIPHPPNNASATPPPSCPMHKPDSTPPPRESACPVKQPNHPLFNLSSPSQSPSDLPPSPPPPAQPSTSSTLSKLNPLNLIPSGLTNTRADNQSVNLPLEREASSIPRSDTSANWEYPSPQQMYNAMLRKGYTDTPIDAVESMVAVHNFLNEGAWNEIVEWEHLFSKGLLQGWEICKRGEEGIVQERMRREYMAERRAAAQELSARGRPTTESQPSDEPKLVRFLGRPNTPTPKARILLALSQFFPESFGTEPPFDRHDWYVSRKLPDGTSKEVRYVIDYYSGGVEETGAPVFYLDIRPALDRPGAVMERVCRWGGDVWWRGSGGVVRELERQKEMKR